MNENTEPQDTSNNLSDTTLPHGYIPYQKDKLPVLQPIAVEKKYSGTSRSTLVSSMFLYGVIGVAIFVLVVIVTIVACVIKMTSSNLDSYEENKSKSNQSKLKDESRHILGDTTPTTSGTKPKTVKPLIISI